MGVSTAKLDYRTRIAAASLVVAPLLMTIGDLFHPEERMDTSEQMAILVDDASRWYAAHLLLFIGMMLFIPGFLAMARLVAERKPAAGYASRVLMMIGTAAFASVFVGEMLVGRYVLDGADRAAATGLLNSMFSGPIMAAVGPAMLAFLAGTAVATIALMRAGGSMRWPAALFLIGVLLILAEILSAQVVLSQIGNVVILCAGVATAWVILQRESRAQSLIPDSAH
jgi:MFS family permease